VESKGAVAEGERVGAGGEEGGNELSLGGRGVSPSGDSKKVLIRIMGRRIAGE